MQKKYFTRSIVLVIAIVIIIAIAGVAAALYYSSKNNPGPSPSPSSTPASTSLVTISPTSTGTQTSPNPTVTTSFTATASPSTSSSSTPTPVPSSSSSLTPTPSTSMNPTPSPTVVQSPSPSVTVTPTPTPVSATFDFDTGVPTLAVHQNTPLDQTASGVTAHFSSPTETASYPAFRVESHNSLLPISLTLPLFSNNFLYPNAITHDRLDIQFSRNITKVTLTFASIEYNDPGVGGTGSTLRLSAYANVSSTQSIASVTANGIEDQGSTYPEKTITLTSTGQPFSFVELDFPATPQGPTGAAGMIIDNLIVTTS